MTFPNPEDETPLVDENETPLVDEGEPSPKGMRDVIEAQNLRIKELEDKYEGDVGQLREQAMDRAYNALNLNKESGIGRAAFQTYEGDADGLAAYVEEQYGYVNVTDHPYAQQIANEQAALDHIAQTAGSIPVTSSVDDDLAKAESRQDYAKTMAIKGAQVAKLFGQQQ